jgi:hypothetical protein
MSSRIGRLHYCHKTGAGDSTCFVCEHKAPPGLAERFPPPPDTCCIRFGSALLHLTAFLSQTWPDEPDVAALSAQLNAAIKSAGGGAGEIKMFGEWIYICREKFHAEYKAVDERDGKLFLRTDRYLPYIHRLPLREMWKDSSFETKSTIWSLLDAALAAARGFIPPEKPCDIKYPALWEQARAVAASEIPRDPSRTTQRPDWHRKVLEKTRALYAVFMMKASRPLGHPKFKLQ